MTRAEAIRVALVNRAGAGQLSDHYLRERIVPEFLRELERLGFTVSLKP